MKETATEIRIELAADVLFDFDKADIRIDGHTDAKGDDRYNQKLSRYRAPAVKNWLAQKGNLGGRRMSTHGFGEQKPVVSNSKPDGSDDPEGRQKNRRVEITVKK